MKRYFKNGVMVLLILLMTTAPVKKTEAALPAAIIQIIKAAVKKVIKAVDLRIQRLQNKTIGLQNAQKTLENALSKLKLKEIGDWTEKQKAQYEKYFEELRKVKALISYYQRIKEILEKEGKIVSEYQRAWRIIKSDGRFKASEIEYMAKVYGGILSETVKNIEELSIVINSFKTQMSDAKRLEIIHEVGDKVDVNYTDLKSFTTENALLSLSRVQSEQEAQMVKQLYGIE